MISSGLVLAWSGTELKGECTVPARGSFMVDVVAQHSLGFIQQSGYFLWVADVCDHFLQEVCVVSASRFNEEF